MNSLSIQLQFHHILHMDFLQLHSKLVISTCVDL